jgi:hypothetical protein
LHKDDVQAALQQPDVVALRGDWTLPSEHYRISKKTRPGCCRITKFMAPVCRKAVLPTLLTRDAVLQTLNDAKELPHEMMIVLLLTLFSAVSIAKGTVYPGTGKAN